MNLPPFLESSYDKVLSWALEVGDYVSEITNTGVGYGDTVASLLSKKTEDISPSWMPKVWNHEEHKRHRRAKSIRCYTKNCPPSISSKHDCLPDRVNPNSCCPYKINYNYIARIPPVPIGEPPPLEGDDLVCPPPFDPCLSEAERACEQTSTIIDSPIQNICTVVTPGTVCVIEEPKKKVCKFGKKKDSGTTSVATPHVETPPIYTVVNIPRDTLDMNIPGNVCSPPPAYPIAPQPLSTCSSGSPPAYPIAPQPLPTYSSGSPPAYPIASQPLPTCSSGSPPAYPIAPQPLSTCSSGSPPAYPIAPQPLFTYSSGSPPAYPIASQPLPTCSSGSPPAYPIASQPLPTCSSGSPPAYPITSQPLPTCSPGLPPAYPIAPQPLPTCSSGSPPPSPPNYLPVYPSSPPPTYSSVYPPFSPSTCYPPGSPMPAGYPQEIHSSPYPTRVPTPPPYLLGTQNICQSSMPCSSSPNDPPKSYVAKDVPICDDTLPSVACEVDATGRGPISSTYMSSTSTVPSSDEDNYTKQFFSSATSCYSASVTTCSDTSTSSTPTYPLAKHVTTSLSNVTFTNPTSTVCTNTITTAGSFPSPVCISSSPALSNIPPQIYPPPCATEPPIYHSIPAFPIPISGATTTCLPSLTEHSSQYSSPRTSAYCIPSSVQSPSSYPPLPFRPATPVQTFPSCESYSPPPFRPATPVQTFPSCESYSPPPFRPATPVQTFPSCESYSPPPFRPATPVQTFPSSGYPSMPPPPVFSSSQPFYPYGTSPPSAYSHPISQPVSPPLQTNALPKSFPVPICPDETDVSIVPVCPTKKLRRKKKKKVKTCSSTSSICSSNKQTSFEVPACPLDEEDSVLDSCPCLHEAESLIVPACRLDDDSVLDSCTCLHETESLIVPVCPSDERVPVCPSDERVPVCPSDERVPACPSVKTRKRKKKAPESFPVPECPPDTVNVSSMSTATTCVTVPSVVIIVNPITQGSSACNISSQSSCPSTTCTSTPICVTSEIKTVNPDCPQESNYSICSPLPNQINPNYYSLKTECSPPHPQQKFLSKSTNVNPSKNYSCSWNPNPPQNFEFSSINYPSTTYFDPAAVVRVSPLVGGNCQTYCQPVKPNPEPPIQCSQSSGIFPTLNACSDVLPCPEVSMKADVCSHIFSPDAVCIDSEVTPYAASSMSIYTSSQTCSSYNDAISKNGDMLQIDSNKEDPCALYLGDNSATDGSMSEDHKFVPAIHSRSPAGDSFTQTTEQGKCSHIEECTPNSSENLIEDSEDYPEYLSENERETCEEEDTSTPDIATHQHIKADSLTEDNTDWESEMQETNERQEYDDDYSQMETVEPAEEKTNICDVVPVCPISEKHKTSAENNSKHFHHSSDYSSGRGRDVLTNSFAVQPCEEKTAQSPSTQYIPRYIPPPERPRTPPTFPTSSEIYAEAMRNSMNDNTTVKSCPPCSSCLPPVPACPIPTCRVPGCPNSACSPAASASSCPNVSHCQDPCGSSCGPSCGPQKPIFTTSQCVSGPGHPYCGSPPSRSSHSHSHSSGHHHRHTHKRQVISAPGSSPCILTRIPVLTALRSGGINFVKIGGISGFLALAIGAYGAYVFAQEAQSGSSSQATTGIGGVYTGRSQSQGRTIPAQSRTQQSRSSPTYRGSRISSHYSAVTTDMNECPDECEISGGFDENKREIFNIANRYHFIHSLALLATPLFKCPNLTGMLLTAGMILFCGSCYLHVLTDNKDICRVTPYGGVLLLSAWLTMIF